MHKYKRLLYLFTAIKLIAPFFLQNSFYQPHRDEFLYLAEGQHMAWGYMEVPPLLSVFAWLTNSFGGSMFWIKIWPAVFGALTFFLTGKIILSLGGKMFALVLGWLPFMLDGYMRLFYLFQPNFLEVFFWTAISFCIIKFIQTNKNKWLYGFGICAGLGMMSKYSVAFYVMSILIGFLLTKKRNVFLNKHFYYASIIGLVIFLPNMVWQYNHNFPVVAHMQELQEEQLQYINPKDFIVSQFMMNLSFVFTWLAGLYFVIFTKQGKQFLLFAFAYFTVIILLLYLQGKDYYALGVYPVLFAFGAYQLEKVTENKLKFLRYALLVFGIALGLFSLPLIMPVAPPQSLAKYYETTHLNKTGSFKWEDLKMHPLPQDFADMIGWHETAEKVANVYNHLSPEQKNNTIIFCDQYAHAAALTYYAKEFNLPQVYSANASFLLWLPDTINAKNVILVNHELRDTNDAVFKNFEKGAIVDSLNYPLCRENGVKIMLYENANDQFNAAAATAIAKLKSRFIRK